MRRRRFDDDAALSVMVFLTGLIAGCGVVLLGKVLQLVMYYLMDL